MPLDGERALREWAGLVDRALSGTGLDGGRSLDRPDLRMAMLAVPPEVFFARRNAGATTLPTDSVFGAEVASAIDVVAQMVDALDVRRGDRVLEIGTGTGYATAVLGNLAATVHSLERRPEVAAEARRRLESLGLSNVRVHDGDGCDGRAESAPYERILVSAGGSRIAEGVRRQLTVGGRMVMTTGLHRLRQTLVRITRTAEDEWTEERLGTPGHRRHLGDLLVALRAVERAVVEDAATVAAGAHRRIGEVLHETHGVPQADIFRALALQHALRFEEAETLLRVLDADTARAVPRKFLEHNRLLPVTRAEGRVLVATPETRHRAADIAKAFTPDPVEVCLVTPADFRRLWRAWELLLTGKSPEAAARAVAEAEPGDEAPLGNGGARHVAVFENLVLDAVARRASDIHLERYGRRVRVRVRVDGDLLDLDHMALSPQDLLGVVNVIKIRADMDISERRLPQAGRIAMRVGGRDFDLRVQTQPALHGEHAVLRLLARDAQILTIEDLGFTPAVAERYRRLLESPSGLVLVVGPTGSGKTTTLYAALRSLAADPTRKVITVEDPIEYALEGVQQTQVRPEIGFGFADALRAFLREDPDVILVGEIRDEETALEAIRASQTGHIVLSTLHCNDATDAVQRLFDLRMHPNSIGSELMAVLAQHLARRVCDRCRTEVVPDPRILEEVFPSGPPAGFRCFAGAGCEKCDGRGTRGRVAVVEFLPVEGDLRDAVSAHPPVGEFRRAALRHGLVTMRSCALAHVAAGIIPLAELPAILPPDRMGPEGPDR